MDTIAWPCRNAVMSWTSDSWLVPRQAQGTNTRCTTSKLISVTGWGSNHLPISHIPNTKPVKCLLCKHHHACAHSLSDLAVTNLRTLKTVDNLKCSKSIVDKHQQAKCSPLPAPRCSWWNVWFSSLWVDAIHAIPPYTSIHLPHCRPEAGTRYARPPLSACIKGIAAKSNCAENMDEMSGLISTAIWKLNDVLTSPHNQIYRAKPKKSADYNIHSLCKNLVLLQEGLSKALNLPSHCSDSGPSTPWWPPHQRLILIQGSRKGGSKCKAMPPAFDWKMIPVSLEALSFCKL